MLEKINEKYIWFGGHGDIKEYITQMYPAYSRVKLFTWEDVYGFLVSQYRS